MWTQIEALHVFRDAGRDVSRVLVLRTASDFDQQHPGEDAATSLARAKIGKYTGFLPALDAAWRVGHVVVAEIVKNWPKFRDELPH